MLLYIKETGLEIKAQEVLRHFLQLFLRSHVAQ